MRRRRYAAQGRLILTGALVIGALYVSPLYAEGRTDFLVTQLRTSDDFRVRTQAALALGATNDRAAVEPLCGALGDTSEAVRGAAAAALGKLKKTEGLSCLQSRSSNEPNGNVKTQMEKAMRAIAPSASSVGVPANARVYVALGNTNNKTARPTEEVDRLIREALTAKLRTLDGYAVAPQGEALSDAKKVISGNKLKAFQLQATVEPPLYRGGSLTVVLRVVMSTYPGRDIKGEFSPKLTQSDTPGEDKASENALIQMAVERVVDSFSKVVTSMM